jgi:hypothetical protein
MGRWYVPHMEVNRSMLLSYNLHWLTRLILLQLSMSRATSPSAASSMPSEYPAISARTLWWNICQAIGVQWPSAGINWFFRLIVMEMNNHTALITLRALIEHPRSGVP